MTDIKSEYADCEGETSCEFKVKSTYFDYTKTGCSKFNPITGNSNNAFYFNILCQDIKVETVGGYEVSKKNIGYIVASFDAGIYVILLLMLFLLKYSENAAVVNVLGNNEGVDSYTIEVRSLPSNLEMSVLKTKLWKHFSSVSFLDENFINKGISLKQISKHIIFLLLMFNLLNLILS